MIKLTHPANISGKTVPAGTVTGTLDTKTEKLFVDAGNAEYVQPKSAEGKKGKPKAASSGQSKNAKSKSTDETQPNEEASSAGPATTPLADEVVQQPAEFGRSGRPGKAE